MNITKDIFKKDSNSEDGMFGNQYLVVHSHDGKILMIPQCLDKN